MPLAKLFARLPGGALYSTIACRQSIRDAPLRPCYQPRAEFFTAFRAVCSSLAGRMYIAVVRTAVMLKTQEGCSYQSAG